MEIRKGTRLFLDRLTPDIEDRTYLSEYFGVSDFNKTFSGGKNSFAFNGSDFLLPNSQIQIEILDSNNNPLYYEVGKSSQTVIYKDGVSFVISILVTRDTPIGNGRIYLVGKTTDNKIVRWSQGLNINRQERNSSKIRFYNPPEMEVIPVLSDVVEYTDDPDIHISGSTIGEFYGKSRDLQTQLETRDPGIYKLIATKEGFSSLLEGQKITLTEVTSSTGPKSPFITEVVEVINSTELTLREPFVNKETNQIENIYSAKYSSSYSPIPSESIQTVGGLVFQSSLARINITNIETFTGEISNIKFYKRSFNNNSDFLLAADVNVEDNEILIDENTSNRYLRNMGQFLQQNIVDKYWVPSKPYITLLTSSVDIINGLKISGSISGSREEYVIVKGNTTTNTGSYEPVDFTRDNLEGSSWDSNFLTLFENSDYTFRGNVHFDGNQDSEILFYLTGSTLDFSSSVDFYDGRLIVGSASFTSENGSTTKRIISDFKLNHDFYGTLVVEPRSDGLTISDISIKPKLSFPKSLETFSTKIHFPVETNDEEFVIAAKFLNSFGVDSGKTVRTIGSFDPDGISLLSSASISVTIQQNVDSASFAETSSFTVSSSYSNNSDTASFVDWNNVGSPPNFVLSSETSSMTVLSSSHSETASYVEWDNIDNVPPFSSSFAETASYAIYAESTGFVETASYVDWNNVDNVPDFVLESETSSMSVYSSETASYVDFSNVDNVPDFVLSSETSSMSVLSSSHSETSDTSLTSSYVDFNDIDNVPDFVLSSETSSLSVETSSYSVTSSYVNFNDVDNVPDFVLSSETSSMTVLSSSHSETSALAFESETSSYVDWNNVDNVPDFVLESETSSMSVLSSSYSVSSSYSETSDSALTSSYVDFNDVDNVPDFVLSSETSSLTVTSSSYSETSSYSENSTTAESASYVDWNNVDNVPDFVLESETSSMSVASSSYAVSSSHSDFAESVEWDSVLNKPFGLVSSSHQFTSNDDVTFGNITGSNLEIEGNVVIGGTLVADEFYVNITTSSILYSSGSTKLGDTLDDLHEFTGSVNITGSLSVDGVRVILDGDTVTQSLSSSYVDFNDVDNVPDFVLSSETSSLTVTSSSYSETASYSITSENSETASYVDFGNIDNVPDFVLESETSSMSVLSSSHSDYSDLAGSASSVAWNDVYGSPDFVLESETGSMSVLSSSYSVSSSHSETSDTASYVDFGNVDNVPDFVLESETSSMSVLSSETASYVETAQTASYVDWNNIDNPPDFVLESETSSMSVLSSSYSISSSHSELSDTSSYVEYSNIDNVPDFVLESETSSMTVLSASYSETSSYVEFGNIDNVPDFVLESETSSMTVATASVSNEVSDFGQTTRLYFPTTTSVAIEGDNGQLFSVEDTFSGTIFSVNDISGIPSIEVYDTGDIILSQYKGNIGIGGVINPQNTVEVSGGINVVGSVTASNFLGTSSYASFALTASYVDYGAISGSPVIGNATITIEAGDGLQTGGDFTTNQTGNETITLDVDSTVVRTSGSQTISGSKTFSDDLIVDGNIYGDLAGTSSWATNSSNINVVDSGADTTTWVLLANSQTGIQQPRTDAGISYNASSNLLTATVTSVNVVANNSNNETVYIGFVDGATGVQGIETDTALNYNPSLNRLNVGSVSATSLTGSLSYSSLIGTPTIGNATITIEAGDGLQTGGDFTTNQTGNETITIDVDSTVVRTSQTSSMTVATASVSNAVSIDGGTIRVYFPTTSSITIEGSSGQLFSVDDNFSGSIFAVSDVSGIPSIEVFDTGEIRLAEFGGNIGIGGVTNPQNTVVISGGLDITGTVTASYFLGTGSYSLYSVSSSYALTASYVEYGAISGSPVIGNATITVEAGDGLQTGGDFTTNQTGNETITLDVDSTVVRTNQTSSMTVLSSSHSEEADQVYLSPSAADTTMWVVLSNDNWGIETLRTANNITYDASIGELTVSSLVAGNFTGTASYAIEADTLDGLDSTVFLRSNVDDTATGQITFNNLNGGVVLNNANGAGTHSLHIGQYGGADDRLRFVPVVNGVFVFGHDFTYNFTDERWEVDGGLYTDAGNIYLHESSSLNADFLDLGTVDDVRLDLQSYTINPKFNNSIGFGNDSQVILHDDSTSHTKVGYWNTVDKLSIRGDSSPLNIVLESGWINALEGLVSEGKFLVEGTSDFKGNISVTGSITDDNGNEFVTDAVFPDGWKFDPFQPGFWGFERVYRNVPTGPARYWKFGTLPASSAGSGPLLKITIVGGHSVTSNALSVAEFHYGNRNSNTLRFTSLQSSFGSYFMSSVGLAIHEEAGGKQHLYLMLETGYYSSAQVTVQCSGYGSPVNSFVPIPYESTTYTETPTGSALFNTITDFNEESSSLYLLTSTSELTVAGDIVSHGNKISLGTGVSNSGRIVLDTSTGRGPQIELDDNNGDMYWAVGADDIDNSFKIHGSTSSMPVLHSQPTPIFEITTDGNLILSGSINSEKIIIDGTGTIGGTSFNNGWFQIGSSAGGITMDTNEIYQQGDDLILGVLSSGRDIIFREGTTTLGYFDSSVDEFVVNGGVRIDDNSAAGTGGLTVTGGGLGGPLATFTRDVGVSALVEINGSSGDPQIRFDKDADGVVEYALGIEAGSNTFDLRSGTDLSTGTLILRANTSYLEIESSQVSINTNTAPTELLDMRPQGTGTTEGILIQAPSTGNTYGAEFMFDDANSLVILGSRQASVSNQQIRISRDNQYVGINRSPERSLDVQGTGTTGRIRLNNTNNNPTIEFDYNSQNVGNIWASTTGNFIIQNGAPGSVGSHFVIGDEGLASIGPDPSVVSGVALNISDDVSTHTFLRITEPDDNQSAVQYKTLSDVWVAGSHGGEHAFKISYGETFGTADYINIESGSGFVGINENSPSARLTVSPGVVSGVSIGGKSINLGTYTKVTSARSGHVVQTNNDFLNSAGQNAHFLSLFPYNDSSNSNDKSWKAFRLATGATLADQFWVNKYGDGYFGGSLVVDSDVYTSGSLTFEDGSNSAEISCVSGEFSLAPAVGSSIDVITLTADNLEFTGQTTFNNSVEITGSLNISGSLYALTKSFRIDHPSKKGKILQHGVLEGPEHAVYVRGKVDKDSSTIYLPDFWEKLVDPNSITVQLTPIGHTLTPSVKEILWEEKQIELFYHSTPCFYFVQATRIDVPELEVEI